MLCPNVNCMHSRHWHRGHGDHHEAVAPDNKLSIKMRLLLSVIALVRRHASLHSSRAPLRLGPHVVGGSSVMRETCERGPHS